MRTFSMRTTTPLIHSEVVLRTDLTTLQANRFALDPSKTGPNQKIPKCVSNKYTRTQLSTKINSNHTFALSRFLCWFRIAL